jgi:hypothetical protein
MLEGPDLLHFCQIYTQQQTPLDQEIMKATISFSVLESGPGCQGDSLFVHRQARDSMKGLISLLK